jgi:hypothetical protein
MHQRTEHRHSIAVICGITEWHANRQTVDTCVFIVRESDWSWHGSGGYNSKKHLFLIYYFANIVLLKLIAVRKQWWMEICASQSSGGRQYWAVDRPVHHRPVPVEPWIQSNDHESGMILAGSKLFCALFRVAGNPKDCELLLRPVFWWTLVTAWATVNG